jgi:hypothetical protein
MAIFTTRKQKKDIRLTFDAGMLYVEWAGGKPQAFPLAWLPKLLNATDEDRADWTLTPTGIHWNKLNEDITVTGL